jgi:hypothetical protein
MAPTARLALLRVTETAAAAAAAAVGHQADTLGLAAEVSVFLDKVLLG